MGLGFNTARKVILILFGVGMLSACVILPWVGRATILEKGTEWPAYPLGYSPIWAPPESSDVDLSTLTVEVVTLCGVAFLAFLLAGIRVTGPGRSLAPEFSREGWDPVHSLRHSFWGQWTLLSLIQEKAWKPGPPVRAMSPERRRREAEETLLSLFAVSFTLFCVQVAFFLMNHVFDSTAFSWLACLAFGALFLGFSAFYGVTLYVTYCEMDRRFWTPLSLANLVLCLLNWYLPRAAFRFSVVPTIQDLAIWSVCTLFFSCGAFVRLNGR